MSTKIIFLASHQPAGNTLSVILCWFELEDMAANFGYQTHKCGYRLSIFRGQTKTHGL